MLLIIGAMTFLVIFSGDYREAFERILPWPLSATQGILLTFYLTISSFVKATFLG